MKTSVTLTFTGLFIAVTALYFYYGNPLPESEAPAISEKGSLTYIVEQYLFDKWVRVGEVEGMGTSAANSYSFTGVLHHGENKFRIKQKGYDRVARYSDPVSFSSKKPEVSCKVINHNRTLKFSGETFYMIYSPYGDIVNQGYANTLDISSYSKGNYCLIYDNKLSGFQKRKVLFRNTFFPVVM